MGDPIRIPQGWPTTSPPSHPSRYTTTRPPPPHVYTSPTVFRAPSQFWQPHEPKHMPYGYPSFGHFAEVADPALETRGPPRRHIGMPGHLPLGGEPNTMEVDPYYVPALVPSQKRGKAKVKKADGKQATFLTKLYSILEEPDYHDIIRWDQEGEIIIIEKPDELADRILPAVYRQSRFASFSRQLNIYGFMRKVSLRHVDSGIIDPDASTWSHPHLHRDSPKEDIINFKRRVPPRPSQAKRRPSQIEEIALSPSSSEGSPQLHADPYVHYFLRDHEDIKPSIPTAALPLLFTQSQSPPSATSDLAWQALNKDHEGSLLPSPLLVSSQAPSISYKTIPRTFAPPRTSINPQSAPAAASSFPASMQVTQGHIRTRSVQGEPPSATFWSPGSPLAGNGWTLSDDSSDSSPEPPQALWLQRSLSSDSTAGPVVPAPAISGLAGSLYHASGGTFGASSLPHNFAPGNYMLGNTVHPSFTPTIEPSSWSNEYTSGSFSDESLVPPPAMGGSSLPNYRPYLPSSPPKRSAIQAMSKLSMGRRNTLTSPYTSPKASVSTFDPPGPIRGLGRSGSKPEASEWGDGGLPSGGLRMDMEHPFNGMLGTMDE